MPKINLGFITSLALIATAVAVLDRPVPGLGLAVRPPVRRWGQAPDTSMAHVTPGRGTKGDPRTTLTRAPARSGYGTWAPLPRWPFRGQRESGCLTP